MKKFLTSLAAFSVASAALALSTHGPDKNAYEQRTFVLQGDSISYVGANAISGGSVQLFDLPEGFILIHGCTMDVLATAPEISPTGQVSAVTFGIGTAGNAVGTGAIASTETNLSFFVFPGFTTAVTRAQSQLANPVRLDGSATAADLYLNIFTTNSLTTNASATVVGTVTVTYSVLGDD